MRQELTEVLNGCLRRIHTWRTPPNYSMRDWMEEMRALGSAAVYQAVRDFDPSRGVPLGAFVRQRVLATALTRYRQEWAYAFRCVPAGGEGDEEGRPSTTLPCSAPTSAPRLQEWLPHARALLPTKDQWLIRELYWAGRTEAEIAADLGISQPQVNKRKQAALRCLRGHLENMTATWAC